MKTALFKQPAGLGDILFTLKIALEVNKKYNPEQIIWPVCDEYRDLCTQIIVPDNFQFVDEQSQFPGNYLYHTNINKVIQEKELLYVPLQHACEGQYGGFNFQENLYSKYAMTGLGFDNWQTYVNIKRNYRKEEDLFNLLVRGEPYILVNSTYGTRGCTTPIRRSDIITSTDKHVIELDFIDGFNLFDWIKIIEHADEVHTLQTSLAYLLDILQIQKVYIYHRTPNREQIINNINENSFYYCKKIHNPNWIFEDLTIT